MCTNDDKLKTLDRRKREKKTLHLNRWRRFLTRVRERPIGKVRFLDAQMRGRGGMSRAPRDMKRGGTKINKMHKRVAQTVRKNNRSGGCGPYHWPLLR